MLVKELNETEVCFKVVGCITRIIYLIGIPIDV